MVILAIDPGTEKSAFVYYDTVDEIIQHKGIVTNTEMLLHARSGKYDHLVVEMIASYGMSVGASIFTTCVWIGRFIEASPNNHSLVYRRDEKIFLCGSMKAKDANIRQALIDLFGKEKTKGCAKDIWAALAVAVTYAGQPTEFFSMLNQRS
jgi:hypothetical protein